ncbi:DPB3 DNA polymerase epsilon subunit C [Candida maltosa Xu316]
MSQEPPAQETEVTPSTTSPIEVSATPNAESITTDPVPEPETETEPKTTTTDVEAEPETEIAETEPVATTADTVNDATTEAEQTAQDSEQDEAQSHLTLPISKIKRIFKMDPDYVGASASAVYTAGLATELFVQYFSEQASLLAKMEKRKKIQYKDFANSVSGHDSLNFLADTIPRTQAIGELVQQKKVHVKQPVAKSSKEPGIMNSDGGASSAAGKQSILPKGQQTLNFPIANSNKGHEGTQKKSIFDLVTVDDERDADNDVVMTS